MTAVRRLDVLPDGTVRQESPVTGTVVWTVPGRSHRPLPLIRPPARPLDAARVESACAFCAGRYLETTPEKARLVVDPQDSWHVESGWTAEQVTAAPADVRRIPNLFPILPLSFWQAVYRDAVTEDAVARARAYVGTPLGRRHVRDLLRVRRLAAGLAEAAPADDSTRLDESALAELGLGFFASTHDLVIPRRHYVAGASADDQLCSSGDLGPQEHAAFLSLTIDTLQDLTQAHPFVRYVSVFQNWLAPAGASLEHLHKQLVGIDDHGPLMARVLTTLEAHPDLFNTNVLRPALADGLVIASNAHAVALAGVGHRYPTVELYSTSPENLPWEHPPAAQRAMSDLLHACHAATGRLVPTNEEWHYRPPGVTTPMPWRINLKWRVSTLAGFEGGTKINVNTISPFDLRERMVGALTTLRADGRIVAAQIGDECADAGPLRYRSG